MATIALNLAVGLGTSYLLSLLQPPQKIKGPRAIGLTANYALSLLQPGQKIEGPRFVVREVNK